MTCRTIAYVHVTHQRNTNQVLIPQNLKNSILVFHLLQKKLSSTVTRLYEREKDFSNDADRVISAIDNPTYVGLQ